MSDFDSNYDSIQCPFCNEHVADSELCRGQDCFGIRISDLADEDRDFFNCPSCGRFFKVELFVHKDYEYIVSKPTKQESIEYELNEEEKVEDVPGQSFFWNDLLVDER